MKAIQKLNTAIFLAFAFSLFGFQVVAQDYKARISVDYYQEMGSDAILKITTKFKGDNGYEPCTNTALNIYKQISADSIAFMGKTETNMDGKAEYVLKLNNTPSDTVAIFKYFVRIENSDMFKDAEKDIDFMLSSISAEPTVEDSVLHIQAKLVDELGEPIKGEKLVVSVKRLFGSLVIGESSYSTDRKGKIMVPVVDSLPGTDGILTIQVKLDSKKYGIVKYSFDANIGKEIVDESTYDQRTMWSPPNKTPWFLLIFPNLLILGIWFVIALLISNLFKIYKS